MTSSYCATYEGGASTAFVFKCTPKVPISPTARDEYTCATERIYAQNVTAGCPSGAVSFESWFPVRTKVECVALKQAPAPVYAASHFGIERWAGAAANNANEAKFEPVGNATAAMNVSASTFGRLHYISLFAKCRPRFFVPQGLASNLNVNVQNGGPGVAADIGWTGGSMTVDFSGSPEHGVSFHLHCFGDEAGWSFFASS